MLYTEIKQIEENAKMAKETADKLFPCEKWKEEDERIFVSPRRKRTNFANEFRDAQILRNFESTVYLVSEPNTEGRKYDAIVNGLAYEFKNVGGNANTLITHFLYSRSQAPNVFINLETSILTRSDVMSALYGARNSITHKDKRGNTINGYVDSNKFKGGRIILKIKGHEGLIYLNVDDLEVRK
jgi:hypothetical protein